MSAPPLPAALLLRLPPHAQKIVQASASIDPVEVLLLARVVTRADVEAAGGKEVLLTAIREYYASFLTAPRLVPQPAEEVAEELRALAPAAIEAVAQMLSGQRRVEKTLLETAKYIIALAAGAPAAGEAPQVIPAEAVPPAWGQVLHLARK